MFSEEWDRHKNASGGVIISQLLTSVLVKIPGKMSKCICSFPNKQTLRVSEQLVLKMSRCYLNSVIVFMFISFNHPVNIILRNIFQEGNCTLWNFMPLTEPEQWMALDTQLSPHLLKKNRICKYVTLHLIIRVSSITNRSNKICPTWMILSNVYNFWTWFPP